MTLAVAGIPHYPLIPVATQRGGTVARGAPEAQQSYRQPSVDIQSAAIDTPNDRFGQRRQPAFRQSVPPTQRQAEIVSRRQSDTENLSFTAQKALKTFADNTPSPGQRLGVELAGVDTFA